MFVVVQDLHFGSAVIDGVVTFYSAEKDATVAGTLAGWIEPPLERQLEVSILLFRYDVAAAGHTNECAFHDLPSSWHRWHPVAAPAICGFAIEQHSPTGCTLC